MHAAILGVQCSDCVDCALRWTRHDLQEEDAPLLSAGVGACLHNRAALPFIPLRPTVGLLADHSHRLPAEFLRMAAVVREGLLAVSS